jgi:hypothetical protein
MQKIFSTRLEEATIDEMNRIARRLGISKRRFLEEAILHRTRELSGDSAGDDVWSETLGAWRRAEAATTTIRRARRAFQGTFTRHQRARDARVRR